MDSSIVIETPQTEEFEQKEDEKMDIISTLSKENGWLSSEDSPLYYFKGFWFYEFILRGAMGIKEIPCFNIFSSDIIISSTPKSGTTWLKALSFSIATRNRFLDHPEDNPLLKKVPHDLMPLIEVTFAQWHQPRDPYLPLLSTHLPYTFLPDLIFAQGCKIVYICRDPKDAFISHWQFAQKTRTNKDVTQPIPLEEAFNLFCRGVSSYGPYWDHVIEYWKAYLDNPNKILFLKYKDLINDPELQVKRLAKFMQFPFSVDEERSGVVGRIVDICSFESLRNVNKVGNVYSGKSATYARDSFFRKGKVGDWKNYMTEEMANKIDQITIEKLGNLGLTL